ncbi:MAG: PKD repeat protein [Chlorobi bacterium OLB5]|nr:MAG: PKD repeat protein [Chlorobi bacterium OLB5]
MIQKTGKLIILLYIANCFLQIATAQPTQEWVARYESPTGSSAIPNKMTLDKIGNCYVFGEILDMNNDVILIKYNSAGDTIWTRKYQGPGNELPYGVIADSIGNCFITFSSGPDFGPYNIVTIKYSPQGVQQWIKTYDSGTSDEPRDIVMDKQGNVYVGGFTSNESLIIKYNQSGDTAWTRKYTETNQRFPVLSIALDAQKNVIIAGNKIHTTNGSQVFFIIKYDSNAVFQWVNNASITPSSSLAKVGVDAAGNVYATGQSGGQIFTVKYNAIGSLQWQRQYDGLGGENAHDMGIDNIGNIIVTGTSSGSGSGVDYVTIKYSTIGDSLWVKKYNGSANDNDEAYSLSLDDSNNIYITGRSRNSGVTWDYVTVKYLSNGSQSWLATYNNSIANSEDIAYEVAVDKNSNVFVTGLSDRGGVIFDYVTIKYSQTVGIISNSNNTPLDYLLHQNYPNPFNPSTIIKYQLYKKANVELNVYDITGKLVKQLLNKEQNIGIYYVEYTSDNVSSGMYLYTLSADNFKETKK